MVLCTVPIGNFYLIHSVIPHGSGIGSQQIPDHFNRIWDLGSGILFFIHRTEIFGSTDPRSQEESINHQPSPNFRLHAVIPTSLALFKFHKQSIKVF